ncbi:AVL9-like protein [Histoplasma capsulatum G186AR]|uniref:AVL9-like protein n=1 Tax=Ajellomyces capsulatus TaxID=5037 RepID=A0A8H8CXF7_AJECA|nr:AVL9-like protein [Histoplasma capsulatum]QSS74750.1 AVL9-like protein [Histoplasma capsulatum G186AR]
MRRRKDREPIILVIDFHHARGPEVEHCFCKQGADVLVKNDWSLLPFMALSDGAHASTEDFSYFTLQQSALDSEPATSLFGISCTRQIDSASLINRPPEVTRSTVQKAVVAVIDEPRHFGQLRQKLSIVTSAWFAQRDFSDTDILKIFQESLAESLDNDEGQQDGILGLSLREMIYEFKHQTLVFFKCLLLQPKMLFFGTRCERLCMIQFSLISLIPGLIHHLEDCADPSFDSYGESTVKPTSLKTSERSSLLAYMGLPLQIFGKGSMFGPYIPLQRLDLLADYGTKSYVVGSTNSLLLQQKDRYSDILINLDENTINISSPSLRSALSLSAADRRWIDFLTQSIYETWDDAQPERPNTHGYLGSEEFIRLQFEEYLLALLSCEKLHHEMHCGSGTLSPGLDIEGDPVSEFGTHFLERWRTTPNYALFHRLTSDSHLFSIVEPRHPCAGGLGIHDIQRRLAQQIAELHLDERVREGREALNKHLATSQKRVNFAFNSFWADINQRKKNEHQRRYSEEFAGSESVDNNSISSPRTSISTIATSSGAGPWTFGARKAPVVDIAQAQATVAAAGQRASSYFSSWGAWANDRRKEWQEKKASGNNSPVSSTTPLAFPQSLSLTTTQSSNYPGDLAGKNREGVQGKGHDYSGSVSSPSTSFSRKGWGNLLWKSSGTHSFDPDIQNNVNHNNSSGQIPRGSRDLNRRDIITPDNENDSNRTNSNARIDDAIAVSSTNNPSPPELPPTALPSRDKDSVPPSMVISAPISPPTLTAADKQQLKDQPLEPAISPLNLDEPVRCDPFTVVDLSAPTQSLSNSEATEDLKAEKK